MPSPITRRQAAALLAYLAILSLLPGLFLPVLEVSRFGGVTDYSILDGIVALWRGGNLGVALVILVFSVIFPLAKLAAILFASLGPEPSAGRRRLAGLALTLGKYSMLDVFVVALLILVFKLGGMIEARVAGGLYLFVLAIALTTLANLLVVTGGGRDVTDQPTAEDDAAGTAGGPAGRGFLARVVGLVLAPVVLVAIGLAVYLSASPGIVSEIFIQRLPGIDIQIVGLPDAPDYLLELRLSTGDSHRTASKVDTPIGNGILFPVPEMEIALLDEIALFDDNSISVSGLEFRVLPDEIVDRVIIGAERVAEGQKMRFELRGAEDPVRAIGLVISGIGGLWLAIGLAVLLLGLARART